MPIALLAVFILGGSVDTANDRCTCAENREAGGWCGICQVGYVAAVRIESKAFFEAIDAHGHHIRPDSIRCAACRAALPHDGFCEECRVGFVDKEAYFSRLTYLLGRGRLTPMKSIDCPECRKLVERPGWCDKCDHGMVGHVAYRDRRLFSQAVQAHAVLRESIRSIPDCLSCAIAKAVDRKCRKCGKSFENGKLVSPGTTGE